MKTTILSGVMLLFQAKQELCITSNNVQQVTEAPGVKYTSMMISGNTFNRIEDDFAVCYTYGAVSISCIKK